VDTGFDLSVYPHSLLSKRPTTNYELYAASGSVIHTYGWHTISLNLDLRRDFTWRFLVADVTKPIIGVDFLSHFNLLVDIRNQRLVDGIKSLTTAATVSKQPSQSVKAMSSDAKVYPLLAEYPELTRPSGAQRDIKHSTVNHIRTTPGPPVNSRPRRLDPERLR
jgi:predicted aspartyl protease